MPRKKIIKLARRIQVSQEDDQYWSCGPISVLYLYFVKWPAMNNCQDLRKYISLSLNEASFSHLYPGGFYTSIGPLSLTIRQPQSAIFTFVGGFWSESPSISFVECVWVSELSGPTLHCLSRQKGGFVPRLECGAAMRVRPTVVGRASSDIVRRPSSMCWPTELKLAELAERLAAAPLALNQHMPCHHQNQHLGQKHWFWTMFEPQDYKLSAALVKIQTLISSNLYLADQVGK